VRPIAEFVPEMMRRGPARLVSLTLIVAVLTACSGCTAVTGAGDDSTTVPDTGDIQADPSHSSSADPDYSVVFSDDEVKRSRRRIGRRCSTT